MKKLLWVVLLLLAVGDVYPEDGETTQTDGLPSEINQFQFVIGTWDVQIFWQSQDGKWVDYQATWRCEWLAGGYMVHQNWDGPYLKGSEFRAWDVEKKKWIGHNFYAGKPWTNTEGVFRNGEMVIYISGVSDARGDYINRETYHDIKPKSFAMKSDRSYDGGKTWEPGKYHLKATRK